MTALTGAVAVLAVGVALPALLVKDGTEGYSGEDRAYANYALLYDQDLNEYPFPIDPTVARRVTMTEVRDHTSDEACEIDTDAYPAVGDDPNVTGFRSAEVFHYGPFFVPTGKSVLRCEFGWTVRYLEPKNEDRPLYAAYMHATSLLVLLELLAIPLVPSILLIGGALLAWRAGGRADRVIGLAALAEGTALSVATVAHFVAYYVA